MSIAVDQLLNGINAFPIDTRPIGGFAPPTMRALANALEAMPIRRSAETGIGTATLLLSQFSSNHTVFTAVDPRQHVSELLSSPFFRGESVEFVIGPSQRTLPRYSFDQQLNFALIDGPHAFPFPDLDYYFLYQQLAPGALLVLNNIEIPTIRNLFNFLNEEKMFQLIAVHDKTAFYRRTNQPTFDPECDGWLYQLYNIKNVPAELRQYV